MRAEEKGSALIRSLLRADRRCLLGSCARGQKRLCCLLRQRRIIVRANDRENGSGLSAGVRRGGERGHR